MEISTAYVDVDGINMCCYCGRVMVGKTKNTYPAGKSYYQCICKKAKKELRMEMEIAKIFKTYKKDLHINWNQVEANKRRLRNRMQN